MKIRYKETGREETVLKRKPKGWVEMKGTLTQPIGTVWIKNGSFFIDTKSGRSKNPNYKQKLLIKDEKLFNARSKERTCAFEIINQQKSIKRGKKQ